MSLVRVSTTTGRWRPGAVPGPGSRRGASDLVIALFRQDGLCIRPGHLRDWVRRRQITRYPDGYDLDEVAAYLARRGLVTCEDRSERATLVPREYA